MPADFCQAKLFQQEPPAAVKRNDSPPPADAATYPAAAHVMRTERRLQRCMTEKKVVLKSPPPLGRTQVLFAMCAVCGRGRSCCCCCFCGDDDEGDEDTLPTKRRRRGGGIGRPLRRRAERCTSVSGFLSHVQSACAAAAPACRGGPRVPPNVSAALLPSGPAACLPLPAACSCLRVAAAHA